MLLMERWPFHTTPDKKAQKAVKKGERPSLYQDVVDSTDPATVAIRQAMYMCHEQDPNDRATQESEFGLELRTRDRERKLLRKIDSALARIDDGSYGYCDETGEEIGLKRLEARPVATLSLEAQERRELAERQFRDRDDRYR